MHETAKISKFSTLNRYYTHNVGQGPDQKECSAEICSIKHMAHWWNRVKYGCSPLPFWRKLERRGGGVNLPKIQDVIYEWLLRTLCTMSNIVGKINFSFPIYSHMQHAKWNSWWRANKQKEPWIVLRSNIV